MGRPKDAAGFLLFPSISSLRAAAACAGCAKCKSNGMSVCSLAITSGAPSHGWPGGIFDTNWLRFGGITELAEAVYSPSGFRILVLGAALRARQRATTDGNVSPRFATGNPGSFMGDPKRG
jgi:hypothetical protein